MCKQCGRQSIQSRGGGGGRNIPKKARGGGQSFFLLIFALKKHAVHNAITSIINCLMQLKIILIGVPSSELLFPVHFCNYFE